MQVLQNKLDHATNNIEELTKVKDQNLQDTQDRIKIQWKQNKKLKAELSQGKEEIARLRTIVREEGGDEETGRVQAVVSEARQGGKMLN